MNIRIAAAIIAAPFALALAGPTSAQAFEAPRLCDNRNVCASIDWNLSRAERTDAQHTNIASRGRHCATSYDLLGASNRRLADKGSNPTVVSYRIGNRWIVFGCGA